jgi:hypothetical protein
LSICEGWEFIGRPALLLQIYFLAVGKFCLAQNKIYIVVEAEETMSCPYCGNGLLAEVMLFI